MKYLKLIILLTVVSLSAAMAADQLKIAYIYSEQIMAEYEEAVDAMKKLEVEAQELQKVYQEMQVSYQNLAQEYEKRKLVSSDAWKRQKQKEIQDKERALQQFQVEKFGQSGEIYQKEAQYLNPILEKINEILKQLGEDKGYTYIFDASKGTIVYADESNDITKVVLEELRKSK